MSHLWRPHAVAVANQPFAMDDGDRIIFFRKFGNDVLPTLYKKEKE